MQFFKILPAAATCLSRTKCEALFRLLKMALALKENELKELQSSAKWKELYEDLSNRHRELNAAFDALKDRFRSAKDELRTLKKESELGRRD